jgi:hypothetical protein
MPHIAFSPLFRAFTTRQEALGSIADYIRGVLVREFRLASAIAELAERRRPHSMTDARRASREFTFAESLDVDTLMRESEALSRNNRM